MAENLLKAEKIISAWNAGETQFFIQTSGSTGEPKGFTLEKSKIEWSCKILGEFIKVMPTDSIFCCLPANKIGGWMQIARSLVWHIPVEVVEPSGDPFLNMAGSFSIVSVTPMQLHNIMENAQSRDKLNRFRIVLVGGGEVSQALERKTQGMGPHFYHTYGMTETYSQIAIRKLNIQREFVALPGTEIKIDTDGCLSIKNVCTNDSWLKTNDTAVYSNHGFIITGRADNIVNSGGIKIAAELVESMFSDALDLPEGSFFYAGIADEKLGQKPVLLINKKIISELPEWEFLFNENPYSKPKKIIYLDDFIYTETGKIQRGKTVGLLSAGF